MKHLGLGKPCAVGGFATCFGFSKFRAAVGGREFSSSGFPSAGSAAGSRGFQLWAKRRVFPEGRVGLEEPGNPRPGSKSALSFCAAQAAPSPRARRDHRPAGTAPPLAAPPRDAAPRESPQNGC